MLKTANICAFLMGFFVSAVYLHELTNDFKSVVRGNLNGYWPCGTKKNCAWIRTLTPIFNKSVPNQAKRTKMVNQQMSRCGDFIIGAVCICSKKSRAVESSPRNILSGVTCILYNSVLWSLKPFNKYRRLMKMSKIL